MENDYESQCRQLIKVEKIPKIDSSELHTNKKIGEGGQAIVYAGTWGSQKVAIKLLTEIDWKSLLQELYIISKFKHENVPIFHGISEEGKKMMIIFELITGDTLENLLVTNASQFTDKNKLSIALSISEVIASLNSYNLIHRDLKSANVMVDKNNKTYVIDFGIAKVGDNLTGAAATRAIGSIEYVAPEVFSSDDYNEAGDLMCEVTHKVDVWAFGCIVSNIFSGFKPWSVSKTETPSTSIEKSLVTGKPFPIPKNIKNEKIREIIAMATKSNAQERAEIDTLREMLYNIEI